MDILRLNKANNKIKIISLIFTAFLILWISKWPEIYVFATPSDMTISERLLNIPIHLSDDVMISLRSGYMLNKIGFPSFNFNDLSNPSTSYFAPYLYFLLNKFLPHNFSTLIYALFGFLSVLFTFAIIIYNSRSFFNGLIAIFGFTISSTSINFSLNGWDHLFQTFFLLYAIYLYFKEENNKLNFILTGVSLAFAFLWRPDAIIIIFSIFVSMIIKTFNSKKINNYLYSFIPFLSICLPFLISNYLNFGYLTPTTARLKIGATPSVKYSIFYLINNTLLDFSIITVFLILILIYIFNIRKKTNLQIDIIVIGSFLTAAVASFNSDVFAGGRMFWAPASILCLFICKFSSPLISSPLISEETKFLNFNFKDLNFSFGKNYLKIIITCFLSLSLFFYTVKILKNKFLIGAISSSEIHSSNHASQFAVANWIKNNLDPKDGSIGFLYLGISYHLNDFSIADFLGKADEQIAQTKSKLGKPGHNKYDVNATLDKWDPQAIVPPYSLRYIDKKFIETSKNQLANNPSYTSFKYSLFGNKRILDNYSFCYVKQSEKKLIDTWGLMIRNDILKKQNSNTICKSFN